eukprot:7984506-Pyramimonas_sp.AAC.1
MGAAVGPSIKSVCSVARGGPIPDSSWEAAAGEVFCKSRFTTQVGKFGLHPGYVLDFTTGWGLE